MTCSLIKRRVTSRNVCSVLTFLNGFLWFCLKIKNDKDQSFFMYVIIQLQSGNFLWSFNSKSDIKFILRTFYNSSVFLMWEMYAHQRRVWDKQNEVKCICLIDSRYSCCVRIHDCQNANDCRVRPPCYLISGWCKATSEACMETEMTDRWK